MGKILIRSGIQDKHPGSATLIFAGSRVVRRMPLIILGTIVENPYPSSFFWHFQSFAAIVSKFDMKYGSFLR
jgi:hypothetical protein